MKGKQYLNNSKVCQCDTDTIFCPQYTFASPGGTPATIATKMRKISAKSAQQFQWR